MCITTSLNGNVNLITRSRKWICVDARPSVNRTPQNGGHSARYNLLLVTEEEDELSLVFLDNICSVSDTEYNYIPISVKVRSQSLHFQEISNTCVLALIIAVCRLAVWLVLYLVRKIFGVDVSVNGIWLNSLHFVRIRWKSGEIVGLVHVNHMQVT